MKQHGSFLSDCNSSETASDLSLLQNCLPFFRPRIRQVFVFRRQAVSIRTKNLRPIASGELCPSQHQNDETEERVDSRIQHEGLHSIQFQVAHAARVRCSVRLKSRLSTFCVGTGIRVEFSRRGRREKDSDKKIVDMKMNL